MTSNLAFILNLITLRKLCFFYFFISPLLLNQGDRFPIIIIYSFGYFICLLILLLDLANRLINADYYFRLNIIFLLVWILVFLTLNSIIWNTPWKLLTPSAYFFRYLKVFFPIMCLFVFIRIFDVRDFKKFYFLLKSMVILSVAFIIPEIFFDLGKQSDRLSSFFEDPNMYALFLNTFYSLLFPIAVDKIKLKSGGGTQLFAVLMIYFLIILTGSRSGIVTLIVITFATILSSRSKKIITVFTWALLPALAGLALSIYLRYSSGLAMQSDLGRLWTYLVGWEIFKHRPFTGIGFGNILEVYREYGGVFYYLLGRPLEIHNTLLEIIAEIGIFGGLTYAFICFIPFSILVRKIIHFQKENFPLIETASINIILSYFTYGLFYHNYLGHDGFWTTFCIPLLALKRNKFEFNKSETVS